MGQRQEQGRTVAGDSGCSLCSPIAGIPTEGNQGGGHLQGAAPTASFLEQTSAALTPPPCSRSLGQEPSVWPRAGFCLWSVAGRGQGCPGAAPCRLKLLFHLRAEVIFLPEISHPACWLLALRTPLLSASPTTARILPPAHYPARRQDAVYAVYVGPTQTPLGGHQPASILLRRANGEHP